MWIALLTFVVIMLLALGMERIEAALPHAGGAPVDEPQPDSAAI